MNRSLSNLSVRSLVAVALLGAPITAQSLIEFRNGDPANAVDVNSNFRALRDTLTALSQPVTNLTNLLDAQLGALTVLGSARINGDLSLTTNNRFLFGPIDENTDSVYFERLNPAVNETQLHLVLGDDPAASLDRFDIGTQTSTFHPILSAVSNGTVGINVASPTAALDIAGNLRVRVGDQVRFGADNENGDPVYFLRGTGITGETALLLRVGDDGSSLDRVDISMGTTGTPTFQLLGNGTALKPGGGSWSQPSDARLKKNIRPLTGALDQLLALRGTSFEYLDPTAPGHAPGVRTGFLAQEVEKVIPEWVEELPNGMKCLTITGFEARAVEALREIDAKNASLVVANQALAKECEELRARVASLEAMAADVAAMKTAMQSLLAK